MKSLGLMDQFKSFTLDEQPTASGIEHYHLDRADQGVPAATLAR